MIKFYCPDCKKNREIEVVYNAVVSYCIEDMDEKTGMIDVCSTTPEYEELIDIDRFQCLQCGFTIEENEECITDPTKLSKVVTLIKEEE